MRRMAPFVQGALCLFTKELNSTGAPSKCCPLEKHLEREAGLLPERSNDPFSLALKCKLSLLWGAFLEHRLKGLNFLVKGMKQPPPSTLDVMRWQRLGALRWLLTQLFVDLLAVADQDPGAVVKGKSMAFLDGGEAPSRVPVGAFPCSAAIEHDDLQPLQWLIDSKSAPLLDIRCNGWSPLHCCSCFGCSEIFLWL